MLLLLLLLFDTIDYYYLLLLVVVSWIWVSVLIIVDDAVGCWVLMLVS